MRTPGVLARLAEPPVDPTGPQGRKLLRDELDKLPYQESKSLLDTITRWVVDQLEGITGGGGGVVAKLIILLLVAAVCGLIAYAATRVTRSRGARRGSVADAVLDEESVSAAEYRARARAADQRGEHSAALLDWFRAIARAADERALLGENPTQTAHELAGQLATFFPDEAVPLRRAGDAFDDVRYGERRVGAEASATMRALDERIGRARPHHPDAALGADLVGPGRWAP